MPARSKTESSTPRLSEVARHVVIPEGIVTTAWPRVVAKCAEVGVTFDAWQHGVGTISLGKRADGKYAATVGGVVLSIPRQVGKTFIVGMIVIALCLLHPGLTVLWSAHRTRTATKTFGSLKAMTSRKKLAPFVLDPRNTNGEQEIRFRNGSVIMFGAREQGFGRGFDEVDVEVFDEAQILTEKALEDMVAATNQSRQESGALLFFMGTPPRPSDPGEEFSNRRKKAISGKAKNMVYVEFSADPKTGRPGGPSLDDQDQWRKANPSFPDRTPVESMERMRENLTDDSSFSREALGIWDVNDSASLVSKDAWGILGTATPPHEGRTSYGVKFSADGTLVSLAVALRPADGPVHVEVVPHPELELASVPLTVGTEWLEDFLVERWRDAAAITIDGKAGAMGLVQALLVRKVSRQVLNPIGAGDMPSTDQVIAAHTMLLAAIRSGSLSHYAQGPLDAAVAGAEKRNIGTAGGWGWKSMRPNIDVTPLDAVTLAHYGAMTSKRVPGRKQVLI